MGFRAQSRKWDEMPEPESPSCAVEQGALERDWTSPRGNRRQLSVSSVISNVTFRQ